MEKLAQALGMPVAYFHATNDLVAETLLVMSRLEPEQQRELLTKVRITPRAVAWPSSRVATTISGKKTC
jgi:hypothetical protein